MNILRFFQYKCIRDQIWPCLKKRSRSTQIYHLSKPGWAHIPNATFEVPILIPEKKIFKGFFTEAPFLDLNLSLTNGIVSSKIYDKRDDFNFEIVNFPFLYGDVLRSPSYAVYISQLIRFARVCSNVDDFNNRNLFLTAKLLKQGYRYDIIRKAYSKFYHRHSVNC